MLTVTATELPRLMACNGSRLMTGGEIPPVEGDNDVRKEGNAADWLIGQVFNNGFDPVELIDRKAPNGVYITADMVEHVETYLSDIAFPDTQIEIDTSFGCPDWQINGRADSLHFDATNLILCVNDFKYGWKIVEAKNNWTLISHALGFWLKNPGMKIATVVFSIYQPRPYHPRGPVRQWTITGEELVAFYNQINANLSNLSDQLATGEHCYKCPALAICPAARKAEMNAIEASEETVFIDNIDNDTLSFQLDHITRAAETLKQLEKAYKELALYRLRQGQIVRNYSVDNELSNLQWLEHITPEFLESLTGKELSKKKLITPNQAIKSGVSKQVVDSMTERKQKGFKLVRIDAHEKAAKIFGEK